MNGTDEARNLRGTAIDDLGFEAEPLRAAGKEVEGQKPVAERKPLQDRGFREGLAVMAGEIFERSEQRIVSSVEAVSTLDRVRTSVPLFHL